MPQPLTLRELAWNKNTVTLALTVVAAAIFGAVLWFAADYLRRVAQGPEPVTLTELIRMGAAASGRWFDVTAEVRPDHLLKTTITRRRGGTSVTNHFALIKGNAVVVETPESALPAKFLAWAREFDQGSDYYKRAKHQLELWGWPTPIPMSPLLLRTSGDVAFTQSAVTAGIAAIMIGFIFMFWWTTRAMLDFTRTTPIARLRKSVRASEGLRALIAEIDQQLAALDPSPRRTGLHLLPAWLVSVSGNSFSVVSSSDVIWVAPYVVTRKLFGVIPTSKTYAVHVVSRTGRRLAMQVPESNVQDMLTTLQRWAPWAVIGTNPVMEASFGPTWGLTRLKGLFWSKPSRAELIAAADKRREQILAMRAAHATASQTDVGSAA